MPVIQIKDVPEEVRKTLAAEAKRAGKSLQTHLLGLLEEGTCLARNRAVVEQTPLPGATLSMDEIVAAVREARGDRYGHGHRPRKRGRRSGVGTVQRSHRT